MVSTSFGGKKLLIFGPAGLAHYSLGIFSKWSLTNWSLVPLSSQHYRISKRKLHTVWREGK